MNGTAAQTAVQQNYSGLQGLRKSKNSRDENKAGERAALWRMSFNTDKQALMPWREIIQTTYLRCWASPLRSQERPE